MATSFNDAIPFSVFLSNIMDFKENEQISVKSADLKKMN